MNEHTNGQTERRKLYTPAFYKMPGVQLHVIPFSIDISWFSNLFETVESERSW